MNEKVTQKHVFAPQKSLARAESARVASHFWKIEWEDQTYVWSTKIERVNLLRAGIPYATIEIVSKRMNLPIKEVLALLGMPQTTYNKKRRDQSLLTSRDSEIILLLTELIDYGLNVFNQEQDKFQRWLKKPNISLGGKSPESYFDSVTGIQEVKNSLNRIEFGNLA